jgi:hypothetical protein
VVALSLCINTAVKELNRWARQSVLGVDDERCGAASREDTDGASEKTADDGQLGKTDERAVAADN